MSRASEDGPDVALHALRSRRPEGGDVLLANLPPYNTQPWLSMGLVLHYGLLRDAGIGARIVRALEPPFAVPADVALASDLTLMFDPSIEERLARLDAAARATPSFFAGLLAPLVAGSERVFFFSVFRNNVDLSLVIARSVKAHRPDAFVVFGGPEAIEEPAALLLPWVDAVVGGAAETVVVPLCRALLDRRPDRAAVLRNVWLAPRHASAATPPAERDELPVPAMPRATLAPLVELLVDDPNATMPLLMNWGCPYRCGFCSNRGVYGRFTQGDVARVLDEVDDVVRAWSALHPKNAPGFNVQFSDATTNVIAPQFDALLDGLVAHRKRWSIAPSFRGQTLVDQRMTAPRAARMMEAGFSSTFFGLESASDALRRSYDKPGSIAQVRAGMLACRDGGLTGLTFGIPVGMPGETEAQFEETCTFVDWALDALGGTIELMTVLPYMFFLTAQDPQLQARNRGERRGILWRMPDDPAGDPAVRAERTMRLFERCHERAPVMTPLRQDVALSAMLGRDDAALSAWLDRHGRSFDQLNQSPPRSHAAQDLSAQDRAGFERAERALAAASPPGTWRLADVTWRRGSEPARIALFRRADGGNFALVIERYDEKAAAYARHAGLNLSYARQWEGRPCVHDAALLAWSIETVARAAPTRADQRAT